jgi:hypothetical protein
MESAHYSCQLLIKLEFYRKIFKNTLMSAFMKMRPVGAGLFHADVRTDRNTDKASQT